MEKFKGKQNTFYFNESKLSDKIDRNTIPLAIVLGWAGATEPNIYKYAKIYENFGHHTIRFAPTAKQILFDTHQHKGLSIKLLDMIIEKNLTQCPVVIHTFSNAGVMIYRFVSEIVHSDKQEYQKYKFMKENLKSLIFDSGPGWPSDVKTLIDNVTELMEGQVKYKAMRYTLAISFSLYFLLKHNFLFNRENHYFSRLFKAIINDKYEIPLLVYYSPVDRLVGHKTLFWIINNRLKQKPNAYINTVEFSDTEHVCHYLKYSNIYLNKLKEHLVKCSVAIYETNNENNNSKSQENADESNRVISKL